MSLYDRVTLAEGTAETILKQLRKALGWIDYGAMGIKNVFSFKGDQKFLGAEDTTGPGVQFDVRGHWKGRVLIRLDPSDTYTIIFGRTRRKKDKKLGIFTPYWHVDKKLKGVYVSELGKIVKDHVLGTALRK